MIVRAEAHGARADHMHRTTCRGGFPSYETAPLVAYLLSQVSGIFCYDLGGALGASAANGRCNLFFKGEAADGVKSCSERAALRRTERREFSVAIAMNTAGTAATTSRLIANAHSKLLTLHVPRFLSPTSNLKQQQIYQHSTQCYLPPRRRPSMGSLTFTMHACT